MRRLPVYLLLDTSGSMSGEPIEAVKNGVQVLIASAEKLPIEIGSYQFALMVTVDCFLDDVLKAFLEIKRILADKGYFIVAFLDRATPLGKIYEKNKHLHRSYKDAKFHSANEIEDLLEKTGFKIIESKQTVYSLDNKKQEIKCNRSFDLTGESGDGLFC